VSKVVIDLFQARKWRDIKLEASRIFQRLFVFSATFLQNCRRNKQESWGLKLWFIRDPAAEEALMDFHC
jgi:hypothetical protein